MKPPLHFIGMFGIGDCLHQRAVIRQLMRNYDVWLETCHVWLHHDLIAEHDLKLILRPTSLHMHAQNIIQEQQLHPGIYRSVKEIPRGAHQIRNWYHKHQIDVHGSILETMCAVSGLPTQSPDFRLPIKPEWAERACIIIKAIKKDDPRPLMIYRPVVLRREWDGKMRNPDPSAYAELYNSVRDDYFVLSIASLRKDVEWIVGGEQPADCKIHDGSLEMWVMAAIFAQADVVFCNAGMAPVLAQSVGTPSVVVYGGRESYRTTQRAGAHLAPTLGIDPMNPCDCHSHTHVCDKRINTGAALPIIRGFLHENVIVRHNLRRHAGEAGTTEPMVQDG
jgi:hypothetical protein